MIERESARKESAPSNKRRVEICDVFFFPDDSLKLGSRAWLRSFSSFFVLLWVCLLWSIKSTNDADIYVWAIRSVLTHSLKLVNSWVYHAPKRMYLVQSNEKIVKI